MIINDKKYRRLTPEELRELRERHKPKPWRWWEYLLFAPLLIIAGGFGVRLPKMRDILLLAILCDD